MEEYSPRIFPAAYTNAFAEYVQGWDVVIVWDKDYTMVDWDNILRPNLKEVILKMKLEYPHWKHVILTENVLESVEEMFSKCPDMEPVFSMILCADNYFSNKAIYKYLRGREFLWPWSRKIKKEAIRRKRRRVNDIFMGKKVVLIDDLRDGRVTEHSYCVSCRLWTGEAKIQDEIDWPFRLEENILRILRNIYHYESPKVIAKD